MIWFLNVVVEDVSKVFAGENRIAKQDEAMKLFTHLNFGGNCEEAFRFYEKNLGGKITMVMKKSDLPPGAPAPPGPGNAVIHIRMDVAGVELIGNDVPPENFKAIRISYLYLAVESAEAAWEIYAGRSHGGDVGLK